ncbi:MAG: DUF3413 domain-containing protein [Halomonas sp.]|nr:DUF3413 domain-containing protein [Halomonas sp.]
MTEPSVLRRRLRASLVFALCNLPLVWLIALRYVPYLEAPGDWLGVSYLITTWVGHFGLLILLAWVPLALLALILPRRFLWMPATLLATAGAWLLLLDTGVYAQYRFHINQFMVALFFNDKNGEIFSFPPSTWFIVGGVALALLVTEAWLARRLLTSPHAWRLPVWRMAGGLLVIMAASHVIHIIGDARYQRSVTQQAAIYPLLFPATAKDFMKEHGWLDPRAARAERADIARGTSDSLHWPKSPMACTPSDTPPNILFIVIDSWRHDEYGPRITPAMHAALAEQGRRYREHYSGGNATRNGMMSLFYGLTGNYYPLLNDTQTPALLVTQLQAQDYALGIFPSASLDSVGFDRTIFASVPNLRLSTSGRTPAERDRRLTEDWLSWRAEKHRSAPDQPWFGLLFYDAPHGYSVPPQAEAPFQPAADAMDYLSLGPDTDPTPYFNLHRNAVHYDDSLIARIIDDLKASGEWQDTILVVTGDHGQSFNDFGKNYWGHNSHFAAPQTQVPMILTGPGIQPGEHTGTTSHLDVVPTLMTHALGCRNPSGDYSQGHDMLDASLDHAWVQASSYLDYGIIEDERITVIDGTGGWQVVDPQLDPLPEQDFSTAILEAVNAMKRFFD